MNNEVILLKFNLRLEFNCVFFCFIPSHSRSRSVIIIFRPTVNVAVYKTNAIVENQIKNTWLDLVIKLRSSELLKYSSRCN